MTLRSIGQLASAIMLAAFVTGCSSMGSVFSGDSDTKLDNRPPDAIYKEANELLEKGSSAKAAALYERVDKLYPYSEEAKKAILMAAVAYQRAGKSPEAVAAARRYLSLHPGTKEAAQAQDIIAASYYDRISTPSGDQRARRRRQSPKWKRCCGATPIAHTRRKRGSVSSLPATRSPHRR